ncbi:DUF1349 domain-containing protein [Pseudoxanthomonas sp. NC8]|nr:DUF1349 domain-containing protein [Pseudoxanthomonas sp. NC8]
MPIAASAAALPPLPHELDLEAAHGDIRFPGDVLEIAADKGTDLFTDPTGKEAADNAPRALFVAEGDFVLSARVSPRFGGAAYEGGALVAYAGPACWGKLLFERFESGHNGIATTTSRGAGGDDAYHGTREAGVQYLKLVHAGRGLHLLHLDGRNRLELRPQLRAAVWRPGAHRLLRAGPVLRRIHRHLFRRALPQGHDQRLLAGRIGPAGAFQPDSSACR